MTGRQWIAKKKKKVDWYIHKPLACNSDDKKHIKHAVKGSKELWYVCVKTTIPVSQAKERTEFTERLRQDDSTAMRSRNCREGAEI